MTTYDIDAIRAALDVVRLAWMRKAVEMIDGKVSDARAHAENALTERLRAEADGRPTVRLGARSRSFAAAIARLNELLTALAGPSEVSLRGLVRDAREMLYRRAFELHREHVPPELHVSPDPEPTRANIALVRAVPIHARDDRAGLAGPIDDAGRSLKAALGLAGGSDMTRARQAGLLAAWEQRARDALVRTVGGLLSDSMVYADSEALSDLIHPDHIGV